MNERDALAQVLEGVADIRERMARVETLVVATADHDGRIKQLEQWKARQAGAASVRATLWNFVVAACGGLTVWALQHLPKH